MLVFLQQTPDPIYYLDRFLLVLAVVAAQSNILHVANLDSLAITRFACPQRNEAIRIELFIAEADDFGPFIQSSLYEWNDVWLIFEHS